MSVNSVNQTDGSLAPIAGATLYADEPIGAILPFGGSTVPNGFLLCNGAAVSRTTYAALFGVIGTSFGAGDGSTTFNVPDLSESVPVGAGQNATQTIATHDTYTVGEFKDDQFQSHVHNTHLKGHMTTSSGDAWCTAYDQEVTGTRTTSASTDTGFTPREGTTTHGKQLGVNFIIKVTNTALPTDFANAVDEKIDDITSIEYNSATLVTQSNYTFAKCQYTKSGHLCTAFIQLNVITNAMSEINCASGFPRSAQDGANAHFWAFRWDNFNADPVGMYINQNGNLLVKGGISGGSSPYVVAFTYITTD